MTAAALATLFGVLGIYGFALCSAAEYVGLPAKMISFWLVVAAAFLGASATGFNPNVSKLLSGTTTAAEEQ
mgnify:CR=1 FL=1|jgi:hypothetical protein